MTYFEAVGVNYQYSATNIFEAKKEFQKSCEKCITQGKHVSCDNCAIAEAYYNVIHFIIR